MIQITSFKKSYLIFILYRAYKQEKIKEQVPFVNFTKILRLCLSDHDIYLLKRSFLYLLASLITLINSFI